MVRCHNLTNVLIGGRIYFIDADCYSRMTRARMVSEKPGTVVRHQFFENWPDGVESHATAPMDYLIVGLDRLVCWIWPKSGRLAPLGGATLDLAGALISPLLGAAMCAFAVLWARGIRFQDGSRPFGWWVAPLFIAVSPPLVHATLLGRPDHQSLLCLLLFVGLASEERLFSAPRIVWAWVGGLVWGFSMWVSLYEPLVLLLGVLLLGVSCWRQSWRLRLRLHWVVALVLPLFAAWKIDGLTLRLPLLDEAESLRLWGSTIGELQTVSDWMAFATWGGLAWVVSPIAFWWVIRREGRFPLGWLLLLLVGTALSWWQVRWSPYGALILALGLPWVLSVIPSRGGQCVALLVSSLPMVSEWARWSISEPRETGRRALDRSEMINARFAAERMRSDQVEPFLAVWWLSPALAYWSGQPAVAGSGHEGISGIVASSKFWLSTDTVEARKILKERRVKIVVASDSARAAVNAAQVLQRTVPAAPLAERLWQLDLDPDLGLSGESNVVHFRLLRVR